LTTATPASGRFLGDGKYELLTPIGLGSMGIVHLARHVALDRVVAVKLLNPGITARPEAAERFLTEARTASLLRHKNTTHVLDFGGDQSTGFYLVMEYVEGRNLSDVLHEEGKLAPARALAIATQVLAALAEAHEFDIVHRDIKPGNIMLVPWTDDDGREVELVKVLDFGIATMHVGVSPDAAPSEEVAGTPEFMSPEQAQGLLVDPRSDVYAVGALLYTLLCGEVPFSRETAMETMVAHVSSAPRPPRSLAPEVSEALERALLRALEKRPEDRFQSARAFRTALLEVPEALAIVSDPAAIAAGLVASVPPTRPRMQPATPAAAPATRSRAWLLVAAAALLGAGVLAWRMMGPDEATPAPPSVAQALPPLERAGPMHEAPRLEAEAKPAQAHARAPVETAEARAPTTPPAPGPTTYVVTPTPWPTLPPPSQVAEARPTGPERDEPAKKPEPKPKPREVAEVTPPSEPAPSPPSEPAPTVGHEPPAEPPPSEPATSVTAVEPPAKPPSPPVEPAHVPPAVVTPTSFAAAAAIGAVAVGGSLPRSAVARAIDATRSGLEQCYRASATAAGRNTTASARVSLVIDIDGRARNVSVGALPLPGLQACVAQAVARVRTKDRPDTGTVDASFQVTFTPRDGP